MQPPKIGRSLLLIILLIALNSCQIQKSPPAGEVVALVDQNPILLEDFRRFYETDPGFGLDSTGLPALRDELDKLIDQHLTFQLAEREGLTRTPNFVRLRKWEEKQALLRTLYRAKIEAQIVVSDSELYRMYQKINTEIHVRHLFTPDSGQAWQWYRELLNGASFEELARQAFRDSVLANNGGDLGWCKVSQLDETFARAALQLAPGAISPPVKTRWGFHIIQLVNLRKQVHLGEGDFLAQRKKLEKLVRREKGRLLTHRFIASYLGSINPQPVRTIFWEFWKSCTQGLNQENNRLIQPRLLDDLLIDHLYQTMSTKLDSPLIRYKGGEVTVREYLKAQKEIPISNRPRFQTPRQLSYAMGKWIRDELLLEEAQRENLFKQLQVIAEVNKILREQLFYYYLTREFEQITVPARIQRFFDASNPSNQIWPANLKRFRTVQEWKWHQAQLRLHRKLRRLFPENISINTELLKKENQTIDWNNRVPLFIFRRPS